jgi:hypothetical protein
MASCTQLIVRSKLFHLKIRISGFPYSKTPGSFLPGALSHNR